MMLVYRVREDTGEIYHPAVRRDGRFQLADPQFGSKKHHRKHAVFADTIGEVMALVRERGFSLWMKGEKTKQRNLISPDQIIVSGEQK